MASQQDLLMATVHSSPKGFTLVIVHSSPARFTHGDCAWLLSKIYSWRLCIVPQRGSLMATVYSSPEGFTHVDCAWLSSKVHLWRLCMASSKVHSWRLSKHGFPEGCLPYVCLVVVTKTYDTHFTFCLCIVIQTNSGVHRKHGLLQLGFKY